MDSAAPAAPGAAAPPAPESRAIFVGNFEYDCKTSDLEHIFSPYGPVARVDLKRGFAFVFMQDESHGAQAIRALDGSALDSTRRRPLKVEWARGDGAIKRREDERRRRSSEPSETLFVVNFDPERTTRQALEDKFAPFGPIVRLDLQQRFAFVQFETIDHATAALRALNGAPLENRSLIVEYTIRAPSSAPRSRRWERNPYPHDPYPRSSYPYSSYPRHPSPRGGPYHRSYRTERPWPPPYARDRSHSPRRRDSEARYHPRHSDPWARDARREPDRRRTRSRSRDRPRHRSRSPVRNHSENGLPPQDSARRPTSSSPLSNRKRDRSRSGTPAEQDARADRNEGDTKMRHRSRSRSPPRRRRYSRSRSKSPSYKRTRTGSRNRSTSASRNRHRRPSHTPSPQMIPRRSRSRSPATRRSPIRGRSRSLSPMPSRSRGRNSSLLSCGPAKARGRSVTPPRRHSRSRDAIRGRSHSRSRSRSRSRKRSPSPRKSPRQSPRRNTSLKRSHRDSRSRSRSASRGRSRDRSLEKSRDWRRDRSGSRGRNSSRDGSADRSRRRSQDRSQERRGSETSPRDVSPSVGANRQQSSSGNDGEAGSTNRQDSARHGHAVTHGDGSKDRTALDRDRSTSPRKPTPPYKYEKPIDV